MAEMVASQCASCTGREQEAEEVGNPAPSRVWSFLCLLWDCTGLPRNYSEDFRSVIDSDGPCLVLRFRNKPWRRLESEALGSGSTNHLGKACIPPNKPLNETSESRSKQAKIFCAVYLVSTSLLRAIQ